HALAVHRVHVDLDVGAVLLAWQSAPGEQLQVLAQLGGGDPEVVGHVGDIGLGVVQQVRDQRQQPSELGGGTHGVTPSSSCRPRPTSSTRTRACRWAITARRSSTGSSTTTSLPYPATSPTSARAEA